VASEFPFRRILGIELAPGLAAIARRNARIVQDRHPRRTAIEIVTADATTAPLPDGDLVVFSYHPFGRELFARMIDHVEDEVAGTSREIFLIYENPVHGDIVDNRSDFKRWYCKTIVCEPSEIGFGPDESDTVVVWHLGDGSKMMATQKAMMTPVVVTRSGWKAVLATDIPQ
jgi:hypothetical protein